jgi:hypothetical protein
LLYLLSLDNDDIDKWYARLETGYVAGNMLRHDVGQKTQDGASNRLDGKKQ